MARRKKGDAINGWLLLDKPLGITSTTAVAIVRRIFNARKAGHAGTLDPAASGMLPIALGEATKTVPYVVDGKKAYRFTVKWGEQTNTDDAEGEVIKTSANRPSQAEITNILRLFVGEISQTPPLFSAIKIKGERAYHKARKGDDFEIPARNVQIDDLRLIECPDSDTAVFEVHCGKGTYVRSLARDMGEKLGCLGHVTTLRRLFVKPFASRDMILLETLEELGHNGADRTGLMACLVPIETALDDIPALPVDRDAANDIRQGRAVIMRGRDAPVYQDLVLAVHRGKPVALATIEKGMLKAKRVFNLNQTPSK